MKPYTFCLCKNKVVLVDSCIKCPLYEECKNRERTYDDPLIAYLSEGGFGDGNAQRS